MCGRYYIDEEISDEIEKLIRQAEDNLYRESAAYLQRIAPTDIHPSDEAPILFAAGGRIGCTWLRWGFPIQQDRGKKLVFNARCESAAEKPLFRESILHSRIAVPAAGFYEWDRSKVKYTFHRKDSKTLFLAGCCRQYRDGMHFVILTTNANDSMLPVHDRMPLILEPDEAARWILEPSRTDTFLRKVPALLERSTEYEQLRFF